MKVLPRFLVYLAVGPHLLAAAAQAQNVALEAQLFPNPASSSANFGHAVAIAGEVAVVGARFESEQGSDAGAVYVFRRQGTSWSQEQKITPSDASPNDHFGSSVSFDGTTIAVGAAGSGSRAAYVFVRSGTAWIEQAKLTATDAGIPDEFGAAISVDGDLVAVGVPGDDRVSMNAGSAYVFARTGTSWIEEAKLLPSDAETNDRFGHSVSVMANKLAIGAPGHEPPGHPVGAEHGALYVFLRTGVFPFATWDEDDILTPPGLINSDNFGTSVDLLRTSMVVGGGVHSRAWLYNLAGTTWQEAPLLTPNGSTNGFGSSIAHDADGIVIGANSTGGGQGAFYVFELAGGTACQVARRVPDNVAAGDFFGTSIDIDGGTILVGSPGHPSVGSAYVYRRVNGPLAVVTYCSGKTNSLGCVPFLTTMGTPTPSLNVSFEVIANQVIPGNVGLLFYGFSRANLDFHGGKLCVGLPLTRVLPLSVANSNGPPPCNGILRRGLNKRIQSGVDPMLTSGQTVRAQWLQRDSSNPLGFGDSLTNGVEFRICQ